MNSPATFPDIIVSTQDYRLRMAGCAAEVEAAQRLRYRVFNEELHEGLAASAVTGRDADAFDPIFDHLLVETPAGEVVGTYRLQTGARAALGGMGYYSASEFDFAPYEAARSELVELGRACVAAAHRNQSVLALLWRGIAAYARRHDARYLVGCSSLTTRDPAVGRAAWAQLAPRCQAEPRWRTRPLAGLDCGDAATTPECPAPEVKIPRLMSAYLALGARLCGPPAWDREFGTVDFLTWLDLQAVPARVLEKYLG
jgi:putative hemolysin